MAREVQGDQRIKGERTAGEKYNDVNGEKETNTKEERHREREREREKERESEREGHWRGRVIDVTARQ